MWFIWLCVLSPGIMGLVILLSRNMMWDMQRRGYEIRGIPVKKPARWNISVIATGIIFIIFDLVFVVYILLNWR